MWWKIAGLFGATGVALGAFGAHALEDYVADPHLMEVWNTAAKYHLIHALAVVAVAVHPQKPKIAGVLFTIGVLVFCGSLYLMTLSGFRWLGAITPLGGLCFIAGWTVLGLSPTQTTNA
jgi:uncharacterized membrane protein YgdD (TMEM256/DUF423 family)